MKNVLHLTEAETSRLLIEALRRSGYETRGQTPILSFMRGADGALHTLVENMWEEREPLSKEEEAVEGPPRVTDSRLVEVVDQVLFREGAEGDVGELTYHALEILTHHKELEAVGSKKFKALVLKWRPRVETALLELEKRGRAKFVEAGAEDEDDDAYWTANREPRRTKNRSCMVAEAQRDTKDYISGELIKKGAPCVFVSDVGVTVTHPDDWPQEMRDRIDPSPDEAALFEQLPEKAPRKKKAPSTASTAADILGSEGGVLDRSDALGEGVSGGGRRRKQRR